MRLTEFEQRAVNRKWQLAVNVIAASPLVLPRTRRRIYNWAGMNVDTFALRPGCYIHTSKLSVGGSTLIGQKCHIENREQVTIGEKCSLAPEVMIATSSHEIGGHEQRAGEYRGAPVSIGDGCWIGARSTILPGVRVGAGCVIAAGAVVVDDCIPGTLYAGIPAKAVRKLDSPLAAVTSQ